MSFRNRRAPPRRSRRERRSKVYFSLTIVVIVLVLVGLGVLWTQIQDLHPELDAVTLCPVGLSPVETHVVLLDVTDPWNAIQEAVIRKEFEEIRGSLPRFARLDVYVLNRQRIDFPQPDLELCNPGRPEQLKQLPVLRGATAPVVANPTQMIARWEDGFASRVDSLIAAATVNGGAERSYIMETIRTGAVRAFERPGSHSPARYVHIVSDLLQHSPAYSHYETTEWRAADARRLADPGQLGTTFLDGAEVFIYLIDRNTDGKASRQSRADLVGFWDAFLTAQGAVVARVRRIDS